jgi:PAS domain S-box-containing protein
MFSMKALLVEDNPADARLIREILKDSPAGTFQLCHVHRLDSALEQLRQETFEVALLDLALPDSRGMATLTVMQQASGSLPIVVLTGFDDERFALEAVRAGAQDYLVKGRFDSELLVRTIRYAVQRKRIEEEIRLLNTQLELRVAERTAELQTANEDLLKEIAERKRAEAALRESQQWLRVTLTSIGDAVVTSDAEGRVTFLNPVAEALTGWKTEEALGQPIQRVFRIVNEKSGKPANDIVAQVLRDGRTAALANHTALVTKAGHQIPIEDSAAPIRDTNDNVAGVVLVFHDVTERRRAEEGLRQSERRFRTMADAIPQLAWIATPEGWIYWYNRRWYEYTGATPGQMEGWGWQSVHNPQTLPTVLQRWQASIATGEPFDMVFPLRGADGAFRPFLTRVLPVKDEQGRVLQWFGTNTDVSEQKAAEDALRAERDFSTAILETTGALIVVVDREGRITRANRACEATTGYTVAELCGRVFWELLAPEDIPSARQKWDALCAGELPSGLENHWVAKDGSRRLISWSSTALVGADGTIQHVIATGVDITDHRNAEQALIRSEKLASLGRMAATIAHEINNPLAAVMNSLYIAQTNDGLPHSARHHLEVADAELQRVAHITRQALGFYRESAAPATVSLNEILESTIDLLKTKITAKNAKVEKQCDGECQVTGVAGELRQVISNLLSNSLDAIADQGTIKLRVSTFLPTIHGGRRVRVTVADNGAGIDPAVRPHIFEPLFTTKESVGTGLGLWVSKQIIQRYGGSIRVHSSRNGGRRGTTFSVFLPTQRGAAAQTANA